MVYDCGDLNFSIGDWVVVRNDDSVYLGQVITAPVIFKLPEKESTAGLASPVSAAANLLYREGREAQGRYLLRLATEADLAHQAENEVWEKEAFEYCLARVGAQRLEMKLVAVETLFDASKTIFYYTAEERVDFRLLVKELVSRLRTRIEMRQIGVRHETRMIGGLGVCGRCLCCSCFLSNFAPVSVKMAKEQNMALNPAKISGICGRLMCCLAFENIASDTYNSD